MTTDMNAQRNAFLYHTFVLLELFLMIKHRIKHLQKIVLIGS